MIFGSEAFEPLVGQLKLSTMAQQGGDDGADEMPPEEAAFLQRKREVGCRSGTGRPVGGSVSGALPSSPRSQHASMTPRRRHTRRGGRSDWRARRAHARTTA
jgi:hypothetical protein